MALVFVKNAGPRALDVDAPDLGIVIPENTFPVVGFGAVAPDILSLAGVVGGAGSSGVSAKFGKAPTRSLVP